METALFAQDCNGDKLGLLLSLCSSVPHHSHKEGQDVQEQRVPLLAGARAPQRDHIGLRGQIL